MITNANHQYYFKSNFSSTLKLFVCLFLFFHGNNIRSQQINVISKAKSIYYFQNTSLSPSGLYIAAVWNLGLSISVFESFSGNEINRLNLKNGVDRVYFMSDQYLIIVYGNQTEIIDVFTKATMATLPNKSEIIASAFNIKNKILALATNGELKTFDCSENQFKLLASIPVKSAKQLHLSDDGKNLVGQEENEIVCWSTTNLQKMGSIPAIGITAFNISTTSIITLQTNPFSYRYYDFNCSPTSKSYELKDVYEPYQPTISTFKDIFILNGYKKMVLGGKEGGQRIINTDESFINVQLGNNKVVLWNSNTITFTDFDGAHYCKISTEQLSPYDMFYMDKTKKFVSVGWKSISFTIDGKENNSFDLNGYYTNKAIQYGNWLFIPLSDGIVSVWDIEKEKKLFSIKHDRIGAIIAPDTSNFSLYISDFTDSSIYRYDLRNGKRTKIFKDNYPISAIAIGKDDITIGNTIGEIKVGPIFSDKLIVKSKVTIFNNGVSKIVTLNNNVLVSSYGRMIYLKKDFSDSARPIVFVGHNGFIDDIQFSSDKKFFLTTADDHSIKMWDLGKHRLIQSYNLDSVSSDRIQIVNNADFLFYGDCFLLGEIDDSISVTNYYHPINEIVVQSPNNNSPQKLAMNTAGTLLASTDKNMVKVRDLRNGFLVSEFSTQSGIVNGITFTDENEMVVVASGTSVECFDPFTGKSIRQIDLDKSGSQIHDVESFKNYIIAINMFGWHDPLILHKNSGLKLGEIDFNTDCGNNIDKTIYDLKFSPDASRFATYGNKFIKVFDNTGKIKNIVTIPVEGVGLTNRNYMDFMNFSPDGKYLLYVDFNPYSIIKIIEIATGKVIKTHAGGIGAFGKDGKYFYVSGKENICLRNIYNDSIQYLDFKCDVEITNIIYNIKTDIFAISDIFGNIKILEGRSGNIISEISRWDQYTYNAFLSPNGQHMLFNNRSGLFTIDLKNLTREKIPGDNYPLTAVFSPGSEKLYFRKGQTFFSKELATGKIDTIYTTKKDEDQIGNLHISEDGEIIYFSTENDEMEFIKVKTGELFWSMNRTKVKGLASFVVEKMNGSNGNYQLQGVGITKYSKEIGRTCMTVGANEKMPITKLSPEVKLRTDKTGLDSIALKYDFDVFSLSPDNNYLTYMKDMHLYIIEIKSGDTIFVHRNRFSSLIKFGFWTNDQKYFLIGTDDGFIEVYAFSKQGKEYKYNYSDIGLFQVKRFKANQNSISYMEVIGDKLLVKGSDAFITLFDVKNNFNKVLDMDFIKDQDQIFISNEGYYYTTKNAMNYIAFKRDTAIYPFEQMDIKYNRPDKVLEAIGNTDTALIASYQKAYYKRVKKLGIDTTLFTNDFSIPICGFKEEPAFEQKQQKLKLHISASDSTSKIDRFNVWVNESPVWGQKGINLKNRKSNKFDTIVEITLSDGQNRIETSIMNVNGVESYRKPLFVKYITENLTVVKTYFIGIGVDHFKDSTNNLTWSSKDIRDMSIALKSKYGNYIVIDTLFNQNVTIENVRALKTKLLNTTVNDRVIIAYSGHGLLSSSFDYYLSTYNVNFSKPEQGGLAYEELENLLDNIPARKKLLMIDACHSGELDKEEMLRIATVSNDTSLHLAFAKGPMLRYKKSAPKLGTKNSFELMNDLFVNVSKGTGATVIAASAGTQFALETNELQNGVFTFCFLKMLQSKETCSVQELKKNISTEVERRTNGAQKPTSRSETCNFDWNVW